LDEEETELYQTRENYKALYSFDFDIEAPIKSANPSIRYEALDEASVPKQYRTVIIQTSCASKDSNE
jgi:hypothetical protein